jgi:hypothetical protein
MRQTFTTPEELAASLCSKGFCRAVFSSRFSSHPVHKVVINALTQRFKVEEFDSRRCVTKVIGCEEIAPNLKRYASLFKQVDLFFEDRMCHVRLLPEGWASSWTKTQGAKPSLDHNRVKPYPFPEGEKQPFLEELGVMDGSGKVKAAMRHKFIQINAFLECANDLFVHLQRLNRPLCVVDAGCGKGYLTFALALFLRDKMGLDVKVIGIDSREDVISECRRVCDMLAIPNLNFQKASIGSVERKERPDLLIALHACNTATDVALFKAIQWKTEAIAVAPCCQHELASMIPRQVLPMIFDHPILAQKAASLMTDALRCELVAACGYKVKAIEFVDPEHTPKNILLKSIRTGAIRPLSNDFWNFRRLLPSGILLERLLEENCLLPC